MILNEYNVENINYLSFPPNINMSIEKFKKELTDQREKYS